MTTLKQILVDDMTTAMRDTDSARLEVIRMLHAAIQRKEADKQLELDDEQVIDVIGKQIKQAKDSITQFEQGGKADLAEKESYGLKVMQEYMPEQLPVEELQSLLKQALSETGARDARDIGIVIGWLKPKVRGRADMGKLIRDVKSALNV